MASGSDAITCKFTRENSEMHFDDLAFSDGKYDNASVYYHYVMRRFQHYVRWNYITAAVHQFLVEFQRIIVRVSKLDGFRLLRQAISSSFQLNDTFSNLLVYKFHRIFIRSR